VSVCRVRITVRGMMAVVAVAAVLLVLLPIVGVLLSLDWIDDAYALWGAGDMVVHYMEDHDGQWPKGWGDLKPYFDSGGGRVGGSFGQYQQRVTIQWDVDPARLEEAAKTNPSPTFRVISASGPFPGSIGGHEPNEILYRYLRQRPSR
jgi:hypothetical protein